MIVASCRHGSGLCRRLVASVTPYWIGLGLAVALTGAALFLIWKGRGTEWAAQDFKFKSFSIGKLSAAGLVALLGVSGSGACVYELATAGPGTATVQVAHVTAVDDAPKLPDLRALHSDRERKLAFGRYLLAWYDDAQVHVDEGTADDVERGDYFATIASEKRAKHLPLSDIANLQDSTTSILHVVRVEPSSSISQLTELAYEKYFAAHPNATTLVPVGEPVVAVPSREVDLRDEIVAAEDHNRWSEVISLAERFLERHPDGFFAADALFKEGYAQYQLGRYTASAATFRHFVDIYPFHASAPGA